MSFIPHYAYASMIFYIAAEQLAKTNGISVAVDDVSADVIEILHRIIEKLQLHRGNIDSLYGFDHEDHQLRLTILQKYSALFEAAILLENEICDRNDRLLYALILVDRIAEIGTKAGLFTQQ